MNTKDASEYLASDDRYENMPYHRCGKSGVLLPRISLGLWQNFGAYNDYQNSRALLHTAFDLGICHLDLANNYGPPYGSAESTFGKILAQDFSVYRDELFISSKAGYDMWPGPYGDGGSRKYLVSSCDQSLKRTGLDYFDVFYHHRMDPKTPIEESMQALDYIVRSGRAMYAGISNYAPEQTKIAIDILNNLGTPLLIHQPRYNMFDRAMENGLTDILLQNEVGSIVFSPLAQGLLTDKYLDGIPNDSRAAREEIIHFNESQITNNKLQKLKSLNQIAISRGQSLAQMAIAWTLHNPAVTSCLVGASKTQQIHDSVKALENIEFSDEQINLIEEVLSN
ncbi:aldo/keto reductase [Thalassotalea crassostreae]|uniref:aldo/keto reductase n=1 Tax=Thalassotalea crassostreae TaxID=1763536 RepID=UPI000838242D